MLTSFFGKSNPINYLIAGIIIALGYLLGVILYNDSLLTLNVIIEHLLFLGLSIFSMLLLDFVIRKNMLTKNNTYAILLFTCFLIAIPIIFTERGILVATILLLLAFRRILSLRSNKNTEKKILDASLWITLASFFSFWSILFFIILILAITRKQNTNIKLLFIPVVGFFGVFVLRTAFQFLLNDSFIWFYNWKPSFNFNFSAYNQAILLIPAAVIATFIVWTVIARILRLGAIPKKEKPNAILMLFTILVCIAISFLSPQKNGSELLFIIFPLTIIITNYIENLSEFWFKEILLWLAVFLPILTLFLY